MFGELQFVYIGQIKSCRITEGHSAQGECAFYCRTSRNVLFILPLITSLYFMDSGKCPAGGFVSFNVCGF